MNLYQWEANTTRKLQKTGDLSLSAVLVGAALVLVLIALFSRSVVFKSLVAAYVLLP